MGLRGDGFFKRSFVLPIISAETSDRIFLGVMKQISVELLKNPVTHLALLKNDAILHRSPYFQVSFGGWFPCIQPFLGLEIVGILAQHRVLMWLVTSSQRDPFSSGFWHMNDLRAGNARWTLGKTFVGPDGVFVASHAVNKTVVVRMYMIHISRDDSRYCMYNMYVVKMCMYRLYTYYYYI